MPRRPLGVLKNLGKWALANTGKTLKEKIYYYRLNSPSTKEEDLEANMTESLEKVTINEMRRYLAQLSYSPFVLNFSRHSRRSRRFTDAHHHGLTGKEAACSGQAKNTVDTVVCPLISLQTWKKKAYDSYTLNLTLV
jgi:hypothetical protein